MKHIQFSIRHIGFIGVPLLWVPLHPEENLGEEVEVLEVEPIASCNFAQ